METLINGLSHIFIYKLRETLYCVYELAFAHCFGDCRTSAAEREEEENYLTTRGAVSCTKHLESDQRLWRICLTFSKMTSSLCSGEILSA